MLTVSGHLVDVGLRKMKDRHSRIQGKIAEESLVSCQRAGEHGGQIHVWSNSHETTHWVVECPAVVALKMLNIENGQKESAERKPGVMRY